MKLLGKDRTHAFKLKHADARANVEAWEAEVEGAAWQSPHEMKMQYPTADPLGGLDTIFNINGNKYRIWAQINYQHQIAVVKDIGTHQEYMKWKIK